MAYSGHCSSDLRLSSHPGLTGAKKQTSRTKLSSYLTRRFKVDGARPLVRPDPSFVVGKEVVDGISEVVGPEVLLVEHLPHELSRLRKVNLDAMELLLLPE